jgi:Putative porin
MDNKNRLLALTLCSLVGVVQAGEKEELLKLRNTTTNLIKELVKQGVLTGKVAEDMIKKAEADAESQVQQQDEQTATTEPAAEAPEPGEVRVPYVPQFVKDEIRQQVRTELREEVVGDVMQKAKNEKWGIMILCREIIYRILLHLVIQITTRLILVVVGRALSTITLIPLKIATAFVSASDWRLMPKLPII